MIEINNRKYAKNDREFSQSLFNKGGTCDGYYKVRKKKNKTLVLLTDAKGEAFAYVVKGNKGEYGIGTKHKEYYMYDLTDYHRRKLGIENLGYGATIDLAESIINQIK